MLNQYLKNFQLLFHCKLFVHNFCFYCYYYVLQKVDIYNRRTKRMAAVPSADEADGDVDMDNFMVLDSVGSGDGWS